MPWCNAGRPAFLANRGQSPRCDPHQVSYSAIRCCRQHSGKSPRWPSQRRAGNMPRDAGSRRVRRSVCGGGRSWADAGVLFFISGFPLPAKYTGRLAASHQRLDIISSPANSGVIADPEASQELAHSIGRARGAGEAVGDPLTPSPKGLPGTSGADWAGGMGLDHDIPLAAATLMTSWLPRTARRGRRPGAEPGAGYSTADPERRFAPGNARCGSYYRHSEQTSCPGPPSKVQGGQPWRWWPSRSAGQRHRSTSGPDAVVIHRAQLRRDRAAAAGPGTTSRSFDPARLA